MNEVVDYQTGETPAYEQEVVEEANSNLEEEEVKIDEPIEQEEDQFSKKFAALSRKEKAMREREDQYSRKIEDLEHRLEEMNRKPEPEKKPEIPLEWRLKQNPLKALEEMGLGYDQLTELALNDGKLTPDLQMQLIRSELENDYKSKFEELENRLQEREEAEVEAKYENAKHNFMSEIESAVASDEKYELINSSNGEELVYNVIEEHYNETGNILEIDEAAQAVEEYLEAEVEKMLKLNKVSSRLGRVAEEPFEPKRQSSPTLSNAHSAQAYKGASKELDDETSMYEAAKLIKWDEDGQLL
jgi:hypothetical protein